MKPILQSLIDSPLLLGDLPEASAFDQGALVLPGVIPALNLDQKLGHLYEEALAVLLDASPFCELLARNLQIHEPGKPTIGEIDSLLRDLRTGELIHLELATKFYLAVETREGLLLPGPDSRDNFYRKLHRLRTHKLILAKKHRSALPMEFQEEPITARHLIHGCIFDHIHSDTPAAPEFTSPLRCRGRWLTITELPIHFSPGTTFEIIPKPLWPVPPYGFADVPLMPWIPTAEIPRCVMIRVDGESLPFFVTPANYPASCC